MPEEFERPGRDVETVADMQAQGTGPREKARAAGRDLLDRAVEKKDELKQRASTLADDRRTGIAQRASSISQALHGAAVTLRDSGEPQLSDWVHEAAGQVERVVGYLEGKRADGMAADLENLARTNPGLFLGGTYVAGLALGRFLRATSPDHREARPFEGDASRGPDTAGTESGSVTGNLGSTGWSGVGVAPGAFGAAGGTEQTSQGRRGSEFEEGMGRDFQADTTRGEDPASETDVFGARSGGRIGEDASDMRDDFRAPGRSGMGASGFGGATESPDLGARAHLADERDLESERDRDREV